MERTGWERDWGGGVGAARSRKGARRAPGGVGWWRGAVDPEVRASDAGCVDNKKEKK